MKKAFLFPLLLVPMAFSCGGGGGESSQDTRIVIENQDDFLLSKYDDGYYVEDYKGKDSVVKVPSHYLVDGVYYPIVGLSPFCFSKRSALDVVYLSDTIKSIGANAFYESSISKLVVTPYLETIDPEAFNGSGLKFNEQGNFSFLPTASSEIGYCVKVGTNITVVSGIYVLTIPDGVQALCESLLKDFVGQLFLPDSLISIGKGCFEGANIAYQGDFTKLKVIGERAFNGCQCIHFAKQGSSRYENYGYEFKLGNGLRSIGANAFQSRSFSQTFLGASPIGSSKRTIYLPKDAEPTLGSNWSGDFDVVRQ